MKKRGAIHVDWVISMGVFLIYLIVLLVLIKPSYEPSFEGDVLTKMVRDEFLIQNNETAGFVVFTAINCGGEGIDAIPTLLEKLPSNVNDENIYIEVISAINWDYKAYFLSGENLGDDEIDLVNCESVEVGEIFNYNGLKSNLAFVEEDFNFPKDSRNYKIRIYNKDLEQIDIFGFLGEPSGDDKVYVLDYSSSELIWDNNEKKIKRGYKVGEEIIEGNIIINIRVW